MTELNMAYNINDNDNEDYEYSNNQIIQTPQPQQQVRKPQPPPIQQMPQQQPIYQEQSTEPLKQQFTNYDNQYHYQYQQPIQQQKQQPKYPEYSFWDRMVISRREVLKLFILSLVIILGISIEKIGYHYLSNYINSVDLSSLQEFLVRLSFPILVFIILWIIKSL
jgi:ABC-type bacteriocin/lantibiotic exporter with double-glycine peptidase domain